MNEIEAERFLAFKQKHKVGDVIVVPVSTCKSMLCTKFNNTLKRYETVSLKIDYIGEFGFSGIIFSNFDEEYIGKSISISYIRFRF